MAAKFFNAALNTGLGKLDITPTINVAIPGNAYAGTYTSTVTLAAAPARKTPAHFQRA